MHVNTLPVLRRAPVPRKYHALVPRAKHEELRVMVLSGLLALKLKAMNEVEDWGHCMKFYKENWSHPFWLKFSVNKWHKYMEGMSVPVLLRCSQQGTNTSVSDFASYLACPTIYPVLYCKRHLFSAMLWFYLILLIYYYCFYYSCAYFVRYLIWFWYRPTDRCVTTKND